MIRRAHFGAVLLALLAPLLMAPTGTPPFFYAITAAEVSAGVTVVNTSLPVLTVDRYGTNTTPGTTSMTAAIKAAWLVAKQQGGGTIRFINGAVYAVNSDLDAASPLSIPQQQTNGTIAYQNYQTQLYFQGGNNITFDFAGATIVSTLTGGGLCIAFDHVSDITLLKPKLVGAQVQSTGVATLGAITGGSGYANGAYANVPLTGGTGGGFGANITVSGGAVTSVVPVYPGGNYAVNDTLTCTGPCLTAIGGTGSGFSVPVTSISGVGPTVATAAPNAIAVLSITGPSTRVTTIDLDVNTFYVGFYVTGDPTIANASIQHITLAGYTSVQNGEYGVALHDAGDDSVIENLYAFRLNRPFFFYGVNNVDITAVGDQTAFGFQPVVKSYSRSTRNIRIHFASINMPTTTLASARISFQVQCDPVNCPTPPVVEGVFLDYQETNNTTNGNGIEFDYFAGAGGTVQQSTSSAALFQNFVIRGNMSNTLLTTVALSALNGPCQIDYSALQYTRPSAAFDLDNANGFVKVRRFTAPGPTVTFGGGGATGWVFTTNTQDYYISGGICVVYGRLTVQTKGTATGALAITAPFPMRADTSRPAVVRWIGNAGMASVTTPTGFMASGSSAINFQLQGAAAVSALTDANLTATSDIIYQVEFPL